MLSSIDDIDQVLNNPAIKQAADTIKKLMANEDVNPVFRQTLIESLRSWDGNTGPMGGLRILLETVGSQEVLNKAFPNDALMRMEIAMICKRVLDAIPQMLNHQLKALEEITNG